MPDVYRQVRERDDLSCVWPGCGKRMTAAHHILTRGIEKFRLDIRNLACLCYEHHVGGINAHCFKARVVLTKRLHELYGYEYEEKEFRGYVEFWHKADEFREELEGEKDTWIAGGSDFDLVFPDCSEGGACFSFA